ncbi:MAG: type II secretion system protein GspL [Pseudomonadota bacterium]
MPRLFLRVLSEATADFDALPDEGLDADSYQLSVEWLIRENDGSVRGTGTTDYRGLADVADPNVDWLGNPENTVVVLPSQYVLMVNCEVPGRNTAQIRRALPFAAEEYVASDIELMHIAHGPIKAGEPVLCSIVAHDVMQSWLACFASIGVHPGYFITDAQLLPNQAGEASVLFEAGAALVANADQAAIIDQDNLLFALSGLEINKLYTINGEVSALDLGQLDPAPEVEQITDLPHGVLSYLADRFEDSNLSHVTNILQGPYQAAKPQSPHAKKWRGVGALAAVWLVVAFVGLIVQGWWAGSEADRLQAESFAFYKELFPRESQPVGVEQLRRRMRAKLGPGAGDVGSSDFVALTAHFSNVLETDTRVSTLNYADQRRELTVEVMLSSYDDLEIIKSKLAGEGVTVDVTSAEQEGQQVRSRLRMRFAS